jgi:hypothetical protein
MWFYSKYKNVNLSKHEQVMILIGFSSPNLLGTGAEAPAAFCSWNTGTEIPIHAGDMSFRSHFSVLRYHV